MNRDILEEIKSIVESPEGKETMKEIQTIMEKENCSFIDACIKSAQKILDDEYE